MAAVDSSPAVKFADYRSSVSPQRLVPSTVQHVLSSIHPATVFTLPVAVTSAFRRFCLPLYTVFAPSDTAHFSCLAHVLAASSASIPISAAVTACFVIHVNSPLMASDISSVSPVLSHRTAAFTMVLDSDHEKYNTPFDMTHIQKQQAARLLSHRLAGYKIVDADSVGATARIRRRSAPFLTARQEALKLRPDLARPTTKNGTIASLRLDSH